MTADRAVAAGASTIGTSLPPWGPILRAFPPNDADVNVLITGAHGTVGTAITNPLEDDDRFEFTLLDVAEPDGQYDGDPPGEVVTADVTEYDEIHPHFEGQDGSSTSH